MEHPLATNEKGEIAAIVGDDRQNIIRYKDNNWTEIKNFRGENDFAECIAYANSGELIVGTFRGKVLLFKDDKWKQIGDFGGFKNIAENNELNAVDFSYGSDIPTVVIRRNEVLQYINGEWKTIGSFPDKRISALAFDLKGMPVIALTDTLTREMGEGVFQYDGNKWNLLGENSPNKKNEILGKRIVKIAFNNSKGDLLALQKETFTICLWKYKNGDWLKVEGESDFCSDIITFAIGPNDEIAVAKSSGIWVSQPETKATQVVKTVSSSETAPNNKNNTNRNTLILSFLVILVLVGGIWALRRSK